MAKGKHLKKNKPGFAGVVERVSLFLGVCCALYFVLLTVGLRTVTAFNLFWLGLGGGLIALYVVLRALRARHGKARGRLACAAAVAAALALAVFIFVEAQIVAAGMTTPAPGAKYMLVLGARVRPTGPSVLLQFRLDKAEEYLSANPDTVAILCGGQGGDEPMTEAQAMYDDLIRRGVDPSRLIMEDKSVNTEQNITGAMALMEDTSSPVVITTTNYHLYRACREARRLGLTDVSGNPARCAWYTPLNYYTREFFAVLRDWLLKR